MEHATATSMIVGRKAVRLRARPSLEITPMQGNRGIHVVKDLVTLRYFHLEPAQHFVLMRLNGEKTLEQICQDYEQTFKPQRLRLEDVEDFAQQMIEAGLVESETAAPSVRWQRSQRQARSRFWARWLNLLYFKVSLFDPDAVLGRMTTFCRAIFHPITMGLGLLLAVAGGMVVASHWNDFLATFPSYQEFLSVRGLLYLSLAVFFVKVLHELGHALCCKAQGASVHDIGAVLLFFFPTLYCNVSDSWRLPSKWQRILINAAGIWVELVLAGAAAILWRGAHPGHFLHYFAFNLMLVCGVSTLIFNANPLMRFDGYFVLSDWLEIPNLFQRSQRQVQAAALGWFGVSARTDPDLRLSRFLFLYGIASFAYRAVITAGILWVFFNFMTEQHMPAVGLALVAVVLGLLVGRPLISALAMLAKPGVVASGRPLRLAIAVGVVATLAAVFFVVPFGFSVRGKALTQIEPDRLCKLTVAAPGGYLKVLRVRAGQRVLKGDIVAVLRNPELERSLRLNEAEQTLRAHQQRTYVAQLAVMTPGVSRAAYGESEHELKVLADQQEYLRQQQQQLTLRATQDGVVMTCPGPEMMEKWMSEGEQLLTLGDVSSLRAVILVDPADRQAIAKGQNVHFLGHGGDKLTRGVVAGVAPADETDIPPRLAGRVGGDVPTRQDPLTKAEKPFRQHYVVTIRLQTTNADVQPGILGDVCIEVGSATLYWRVRRFLGSTLNWGL